MKTAIVGYGYLGQAYHKVYPEAVIYDEPKGIGTREQVNKCDVALVAVPTDPLPDGSLSMAIIEDVISWLDTPLIIIKSALMPGTVERLTKQYGKQRIAVSVEYIGMGKYYLDPHDYPDPLDPQKHKLLVVGGTEAVAEKAASFLWQKMSPDTRIHLVSSREAEITKLIENFYGAYKVTFANCLYNLTKNSGVSPIKVHQAWTEDGRVDGMHTRVTPGKRGWKSHCYSKDVQALRAYALAVGSKDMEKLVDVIIELNEIHLNENPTNQK